MTEYKKIRPAAANSRTETHSKSDIQNLLNIARFVLFGKGVL